MIIFDGLSVRLNIGIVMLGRFVFANYRGSIMIGNCVCWRDRHRAVWRDKRVVRCDDG